MCTVHIISFDCAYLKNYSEFQSKEVCFTEICLSEAQKILNYMDETVDPCTDFYEFACGKFRQDTVIPNNREKVTVFTLIKDKVNEQMRSIFDEPIHSSEANAFKLVKTFVRSCVNATKLNENGNTYQTIVQRNASPILNTRNFYRYQSDETCFRRIRRMAGC